MGGLVIIRKAINTPSLFNWVEFMPLPVLLLSHSPSLSASSLKRNRLSVCSTARQFENSFCTWHPIDVDMVMVGLWNRFLHWDISKGLRVWISQNQPGKRMNVWRSGISAFSQVWIPGLIAVLLRNHDYGALQTVKSFIVAVSKVPKVKQNEGPVFRRK